MFSQLFAEVLLLSFAGTLSGLGFAAALLDWFRSANPIELPPGNVVTLDWRVFLFSVLLGVGCALAAGVFPAWRGSQIDLNSMLKTGKREQGSSVSMQRVSQWFIVFQIALSLTLLTAASSLGESLLKLSSTNLGYRTNDLLTARINLPPTRYPDSSSRARFIDGFSIGLDSEGVQATLTSDIYPTGTSTFAIEGRPSYDDVADGLAIQDVAPSFFQLMRIPVLNGRAFDRRDRADTQKTVMINQALANRCFKNADPLGKTLKLSRAEDQVKPWLTIVGVVGNVRTNTVFQDMGYVEQPAVYRPISQDSPASLMIIAQTTGGASAATRRVQAQLSQTDHDLVLKSVETIKEKQAMVLSQPRFRTFLFGGFALLALILAMVGLYGVLLQAVLQRTREIGIRIACGANRQQVLQSVLIRALRMVGMGLIVGAAGSIASGALMKALLYGEGARSPLVLVVASLALFLSGFTAAFQPAFYASSIDPIRALRSE